MNPAIWEPQISVTGMEETITEEVKRAIWELTADRAPRPDGFPLFFYRAFWPQVWEVLMRLVSEFMEGRERLDRINYSQMVLIPKNQTPTTVKEFRSIALLNSSLKIISKILAKKLLLLLTDLIGDYQSSSLKDETYWKGLPKHMRS